MTPAIKKTPAAPAKSKAALPGMTFKDGYTVHPFDAQFGVRTSGLIAGRHLKSGHTHDRHVTAYYGVAPSVLKLLIARWKKTKPCAPLEEFTFIDYGCGMGRALLLASELPFKAVVGVELHATLAGMARRNVTVWRKSGREKSPIRVRCCDALDFKLPEGPCLAFLFNPFSSTVLRRLAAKVARERAEQPNSFDLLYVNDEQLDVLMTSPGFKRLYRAEVLRSKEDAIADHRIMLNQSDGEYTASNHENCSIHRFVGRKG